MFYKMRGIFEELSGSQEGMCAVQLVIKKMISCLVQSCNELCACVQISTAAHITCLRTSHVPTLRSH